MVQFSTAKLQNTYYALPNSEMKIMSNVWCSFLIAIKYQISFDQNYKWRKVANVFFFFFFHTISITIVGAQFLPRCIIFAWLVCAQQKFLDEKNYINMKIE